MPLFGKKKTTEADSKKVEKTKSGSNIPNVGKDGKADAKPQPYRPSSLTLARANGKHRQTLVLAAEQVQSVYQNQSVIQIARLTFSLLIAFFNQLMID